MSTTAMGFDFGTKRIGVAAGQNLTGTAQGIATVSNSTKDGPWERFRDSSANGSPISSLLASR